jgi:hypothetical protein
MKNKPFKTARNPTYAEWIGDEILNRVLDVVASELERDI